MRIPSKIIRDLSSKQPFIIRWDNHLCTGVQLNPKVIAPAMVVLGGHNHEVGLVRVQEQLVHGHVVGHHLVLVVNVLLKENRITATYT